MSMATRPPAQGEIHQFAGIGQPGNVRTVLAVPVSPRRRFSGSGMHISGPRVGIIGRIGPSGVGLALFTSLTSSILLRPLAICGNTLVSVKLWTLLCSAPSPQKITSRRHVPARSDRIVGLVVFVDAPTRASAAVGLRIRLTAAKIGNRRRVHHRREIEPVRGPVAPPRAGRWHSTKRDRSTARPAKPCAASTLHGRGVAGLVRQRPVGVTSVLTDRPSALLSAVSAPPVSGGLTCTPVCDDRRRALRLLGLRQDLQSPTCCVLGTPRRCSATTKPLIRDWRARDDLSVSVRGTLASSTLRFWLTRLVVPIGGRLGHRGDLCRVGKDFELAVSRHRRNGDEACRIRDEDSLGLSKKKCARHAVQSVLRVHGQIAGASAVGKGHGSRAPPGRATPRRRTRTSVPAGP